MVVSFRTSVVALVLAVCSHAAGASPKAKIFAAQPQIPAAAPQQHGGGGAHAPAVAPTDDDVRARINEDIKALQTDRNNGGFSEYRAIGVQWEDSQRSVTAGGTVSAYGPNISDVRLKARDGETLFTVRSDNWDEKLVKMQAKDIIVQVPKGGDVGAELEEKTLQVGDFYF